MSQSRGNYLEPCEDWDAILDDDSDDFVIELSDEAFDAMLNDEDKNPVAALIELMASSE